MSNANQGQTSQLAGEVCLTRLTQALLLAIGMLSLTVTSAVHAQPSQTMGGESVAGAYQIPSGTLDQVVNRFATQAGIAVGMDGALTAGKRSDGLSGSYDVEGGLRRILAGSGLEAVRNGPGVYVLRQAPDRSVSQLEGVVVRGDSLSMTTEGTDSYAARGASLMKGAQSLKDIPQSVTVMTRQQLDDQRLDTVTEALAQTPGVYFSKRPNGGNDIYMRGFGTDTLQYNGVPLLRFHSFGNDFSASAVYLDRIEVLRGAQGLLEGAGSPAGAVNLVRKRGLSERELMVEGRVGSWNTYGTRLDVGSPLNERGTLRGRAVLDYERKHSFLDTVWDRNLNAYAALDFDVSPSTTIGVGVAYSRLKGNSTLYEGVPRYADGTEISLPRSAYYGADWNEAVRDETQIFLDVEHELNANWSVTAAAIHSDEKFDADFVSAWGLVPVGGSRVGGDLWVYRNTSKNIGVDVHVDGKVTALGMSHELVVGANYSKIKRDDRYSAAFGYTTFDVFAPDHQLPMYTEGDLASIRYQAYDIKQKGVYGLWRAHLTDRATLMLGGRVSWYDYEGFGGATLSSRTTTASMKETGKFTPYGGLVFALNPQWSAYASYAEIFKPQSATNVNRQVLPPMTGKAYELGIKGELFDGALNTSLALFRVDQVNRAVTDFDAPRICGSGTAYCSRAAGKVRVEGWELEAHGELFSGLQISGGYTYNRNKYLEDTNPALVGKPFDYLMPKHMLRLWANYQLPGQLANWSVGAGVNYRSAMRTDSTTRPNPVQGGYSIWNARVGYEFNKNWSAALNVSNLFDKRYYSFITTNYIANYVGEPRKFLLSVKGRF